jgi:hypothetical protein
LLFPQPILSTQRVDSTPSNTRACSIPLPSRSPSLSISIATFRSPISPRSSSAVSDTASRTSVRNTALTRIQSPLPSPGSVVPRPTSCE